VLDRFEVGVEFIHQRDAGWDVQLDDLTLRILSRYLTRARRLLPWAAMITFWPDFTMGAMVSCHSGRKRATVSFRHSVWGNSAGLRSL